MQIVYGIIAVAAALAVVVVALRSRSLSPALRAEYKRLAKWADDETGSLTAGYEKAGLLSGGGDDPVMDCVVENDGTIRLLRRT